MTSALRAIQVKLEEKNNYNKKKKREKKTWTTKGHIIQLSENNDVPDISRPEDLNRDDLNTHWSEQQDTWPETDTSVNEKSTLEERLLSIMRKWLTIRAFDWQAVTSHSSGFKERS